MIVTVSLVVSLFSFVLSSWAAPERRPRPGRRSAAELGVRLDRLRLRRGLLRLRVLGWHYLYKATCLIRASFISCVLRRVKDHHNLQKYSPLLKKTCVRQVVLDKSGSLWSPRPRAGSWAAGRGCGRSRAWPRACAAARWPSCRCSPALPVGSR